MIEQAGTAAFPHNFHGGTGQAQVQWRFREESALPVAVHSWELPPGGSEGMHTHPPGADALEEIYLLHEGTATMTLDGVAHPMAPGDAVLARAGVAHDLRNTGDTPARLTVIWGRPGTPVDWRRYPSGRRSAEELS